MLGRWIYPLFNGISKVQINICPMTEKQEKPYLHPAMPFYRNFTYWIDKRRWKYYFLVATLAEGKRD
jgi:hypothetical protein